jgi:hypothetical protein
MPFLPEGVASTAYCILRWGGGGGGSTLKCTRSHLSYTVHIGVYILHFPLRTHIQSKQYSTRWICVSWSVCTVALIGVVLNYSYLKNCKELLACIFEVKSRILSWVTFEVGSYVPSWVVQSSVVRTIQLSTTELQTTQLQTTEFTTRQLRTTQLQIQK